MLKIHQRSPEQSNLCMVNTEETYEIVGYIIQPLDIVGVKIKLKYNF